MNEDWEIYKNVLERKKNPQTTSKQTKKKRQNETAFDWWLVLSLDTVNVDLNKNKK